MSFGHRVGNFFFSRSRFLSWIFWHRLLSVKRYAKSLICYIYYSRKYKDRQCVLLILIMIDFKIENCPKGTGKYRSCMAMHVRNNKKIWSSSFLHKIICNFRIIPAGNKVNRKYLNVHQSIFILAVDKSLSSQYNNKLQRKHI